jgi:RNA polymerase primary sigma factor
MAAAGRRTEPKRAGRDDLHRRRAQLRAARNGDRAAQSWLAACHLGLVRTIAAGYREFGMPLDDLVQEGSLGFLEAVARYDPTRGVDFEAFARFHIRRAIRNALTERARLVRLPKYVVERRRLLDRVEANLTAATGRSPRMGELAALTDLSLEDVLEARSAAITPVSLDELQTQEGSVRGDLVADAAAVDPEAVAIHADEARRIHQAVAHLGPRQREIVTRHFGLARQEESISRVAADLRLSERRTRTLEQHALHRLGCELEPIRKEEQARVGTYCV